MASPWPLLAIVLICGICIEESAGLTCRVCRPAGSSSEATDDESSSSESSSSSSSSKESGAESVYRRHHSSRSSSSSSSSSSSESAEEPDVESTETETNSSESSSSAPSNESSVDDVVRRQDGLVNVTAASGEEPLNDTSVVYSYGNSSVADVGNATSIDYVPADANVSSIDEGGDSVSVPATGGAGCVLSQSDPGASNATTTFNATATEGGIGNVTERVNSTAVDGVTYEDETTVSNSTAVIGDLGVVSNTSESESSVTIGPVFRRDDEDDEDDEEDCTDDVVIAEGEQCFVTITKEGDELVETYGVQSNQVCSDSIAQNDIFTCADLELMSDGQSCTLCCDDEDNCNRNY